MDIAYDQITEESLSPAELAAQRSSTGTPSNSNSGEASTSTSSNTANTTAANINTDFQNAFAAVSASPWGSKLGGWLSTARKQGETFYQDLQKEAGDAQVQASKGLGALRDEVQRRTRGISFDGEPGPPGVVPGEEAVPGLAVPAKKVDGGEGEKEREGEGQTQARSENLTQDIVKEAGSMVASLRLTATKKLKDLQKAEDAADEALEKFGSNVRNFLRDAVVISAPTDADANKPRGTDGVGNEVLFETQEPGTGRKVFHSTRLDAQLHAIHTSATSFTEDPQGAQWEAWKGGAFDIDSQTGAIAQDLEKYEELRRAMEKLVPEKVEYKPFWMRYYFLRKAIEEDEKRRKEVLKGAAAIPEEEDVAWDDDDDDEDDTSTPNPAPTPAPAPAPSAQASASTTTLTNKPATPIPSTETEHLKPGRNSSDEVKSVADSDASYDIVSGAASRAQGSPREEKKREVEEESDDDWE